MNRRDCLLKDDYLKGVQHLQGLKFFTFSHGLKKSIRDWCIVEGEHTVKL